MSSNIYEIIFAFFAGILLAPIVLLINDYPHFTPALMAFLAIVTLLSAGTYLKITNRPLYLTTTPTDTVSIIFYASVFIGLLATMIITIMTEYVPVNDTESLFNSTDNNLSVLVKRQSTILIPIRNVFDPISSAVQVSINHHPDFNVTRLKLFTTADSVLTYKGDFIPNENNSKSKTQGVWDMNVYVRHNLEVGNTSNAYTIDIFYFNNTNPNGMNSIIRFPIIFTWPIQTLDFSLLSYFWIVLIGVITSRISKRYIDQDVKNLNEAVRKLGPVDYFSIGLSGIIALLIFSTFQQEVHLTRHIIINISLAFGFGFAFDKVLETGQTIAKK